ncbi:sugar transferase [Candidatus Falkowbacteria bacterium]|nr:sugar transferase [Candidatus Falkowbacteria bacterium]
MLKKSELIFSAILVPLDFLMLVAAALAAYFLRFATFAALRPIIYEMPFGEFLNIAAFTGLIWLLIFALSGLYTIGGTRRILDELAKIFLACSAGLAVIIVLIFFNRDLFSSRFIILAAWIFAIIFVSFGRLTTRFIQRALFRRGVGVHRVVIIGEDEAADVLVNEFYKNQGLGLKVIKRYRKFDDEAAKEIGELYQTVGVDEVIQAQSGASREETLGLIDFCNERHIVFKYSADLFSVQAAKIDIRDYAGVPVAEIKRTRLEGWGRIYKRIFDIVGSLILIIIVSPIMILTAIAIKLDSRGPVFWSRLDDGSEVKRVGQHGELFHYFKFRSMKPGTHNLRYTELAEQDTRKGPLVKIKDDPRITRVGKFIRRFSIDELPEFFLVLTGKMSLVGPRPHLPEEVAKYKKHHKKVLIVKPGITGLAQISGRADLDFEEEVKIDVYYIENWSLKLDLYILFKTPFVVLFGKGAK